MKLGLTTLHGYNYGSILQAYATRTFLENGWCDCELLTQTRGGLLSRYASAALELAGLCLAHPGSARRIVRLFLSQRRGKLAVTDASLAAMDDFVRAYLNVKACTAGELAAIGRSGEYAAFLSGSDQVWNGQRIGLFRTYFLRFAPEGKRIAWAPSFGGEDIAPWNVRRYRKYISEYAALSAREPSGARMIGELTGRDAPVLPDPVMLLPAKTWRAHYRSEHSVAPMREGCLLAFFLDRPADRAVEQLEALHARTGRPVVSLGYQHEAFASRGWEHLDGSPFDFLRAVDHAALVLTDSYHACVFASLFHVPFYAFSRNYQHDQNQSVRLTELLEHIGLSPRFDPQVCAVEDIPDFSRADGYFSEMRTRAAEYLEQALPLPKRPDAPPIDRAPHGEKRAYIAYASDEALAARSASGGVFALLARRCIARGGVVFGAALAEEDGRITCRHVMADSEDALRALQGSKYVQSDTKGVYQKVKEQLDRGVPVLFSGTSCQVAGLRSYLKTDYVNLLTCDLICHGTPSQQFLDEYIAYISRKKHCRVTGLSFRRKDLDRPGKPLMPYVLTFSCLSGDGRTFEYREPLRKSAYYRMFMANSGFRAPCYRCPYACIEKPADLTLGDCYQKGSARYLSCVVTHTPAGAAAIGNARQLVLTEIPLSAAIASHEQLQHPGIPTAGARRLWARYRRGGFPAVQRYLDFRNALLYLPAKLKGLLR